MEAEFILTILALDELKELGYKEVWIGGVESPHWPRHGCDNFVIAAPKVSRHGWPAIWSASEQNFGKQSCGNGLRNADQTQTQKSRRMLPGYYKLSRGKWQKKESR